MNLGVEVHKKLLEVVQITIQTITQDDDKALSYVNFDPNTPTSSLNNIGSDSDNTGAIANLINLAKVPYDLVKGNLPTSILSLLNTDQPKSMPNTTGEDGIGGDYNTNRDVFDTVQDYKFQLL